ncbi:2-oxoacid dehydrogenases acyltransferase-domain-containing protein [Panaeolus papilionaceus]|nr:2-oxoacid dehydrogenases acyltransferase-domain-containing protein [Panaeolus papilionaceus]
MFIPRLLGRSIPKTNHSRYHYFARLEKIHRIHTSSSVWATRKTLQKFNLADIGEGITECEIVKWSVQPNTHVAAFDPLCEVQSDKASVEITSPFDGILKEIIVQEGEVAKVGSGLCVIEVEEEVDSSAPIESAPADTVAPTQHAEQRQEHNLSTSATSPRSERRMHPLDPNNTQRHQSPSAPALSSLSHSHARARAHAQFESQSSSLSGQVQAQGGVDINANATRASPDLIFATPAVRFFAKERGVDLGFLVPGSGKDRRIEQRDVEGYLERAAVAAQAPEAVVGAQSVSAQQQPEGDMVVELGRTRYGMWKAMVKSLEVPHFGYTTHLDITELHNLLPTLNANIPPHYLPPSSRPKSASPATRLVNPSALVPSPSDLALQNELPPHQQFQRLTYLPFLLKTLSKAMEEWPLFRSSITPGSTNPESASKGKPTLTVRASTDLTLALSTPTGLYTPTLGAVSGLSVYGIASTLANLSHLGRQIPCGLTPKEMPKKGGTITVSNVGAIGAGRDANPVLVPGGGIAIVAIGRAEWVWDVDRFWVEDAESPDGGRGQRRLRVPVSWSADHRVVEGAELAAFVECWRGWVERPGKMIGEGI